VARKTETNLPTASHKKLTMAPASLQQGAGSNKSAKFIQSNPLDPILKPFEAQVCFRVENQLYTLRVVGFT
jgi:hypothetical protein